MTAWRPVNSSEHTVAASDSPAAGQAPSERPSWGSGAGWSPVPRVSVGGRESVQGPAGALQAGARGDAHPLEEPIRHGLHGGMDAAIALRGILPGLRAAGVDGGVGELATVQAVMV